MKIEIAQIGANPGYIEQNTRKIVDTIAQARLHKTDLIIFPELTIPGYSCMDLVLHQKFIRQNLEAFQTIIQNTQDIAVVVGFIDQDKKQIGPDGTPIRYNSAAIIQNGKLIGVEDKTLIPTYGEFDESRYFASGRGRHVYQINGVNIGVEICEDGWDSNYPIKVSQELVTKGAQLLVNISASPFFCGKRFIRQELFSRLARDNDTSLIYANTVGSQDGYDGQLVFEGQSMAFDNNGRLKILGPAFKEALIQVDYPFQTDEELVAPAYNPIAELHQALVLGIRSYFERSKLSKVFIGLSGGVDSAVVATLAVDALGKELVKGIGMPSKYSSQGSVDDAEALAKNLGIDFSVIPINRVFNEFCQSLADEFSGMKTDVTEENLQARIRGTLLMAEANKFNGLVLSTGNKTETALGYTTIYGDMCGGLAPISDVSKLRIYELARFVNLKREIIPQNTLVKPPSAELSDNQTDEAGLGASYEILSPLVDEIVEQRKETSELINRYPEQLIQRVNNLISRNEYKRRQAPPGIKVTPLHFGLCRRIPINHDFRG